MNAPSAQADDDAQSVSTELKAVQQERSDVVEELKVLKCLIHAARATGNEKEVDALRAKEASLDAKELRLLDLELLLRRKAVLEATKSPPVLSPDILLRLGKLGLFDSDNASSSACSSQDSVQSELRTSALQAYGLHVENKSLMCPILLIQLPARVITCSHLVPRLLRDEWPALGVDVIATRNVMFMFKCVEEAFDGFLLSFVPVSGTELYRVHVWDPLLRVLPVTINVHRRDCLQRFDVAIPAVASRLTFGDLHNQERMLASANGHAPYRRALLLQAVLAREKARRRGWDDVELHELSSSILPDISPEKLARILQWRDNAFGAGSGSAPAQGV